MKHKGGNPAYLWEREWFSDDKLFDIQNITRTLEHHNTPGNDLNRKYIDDYLKSIMHDDVSSLYAEIDSKIKLKIGDGIKQLLRFQKDVRYVKELVELRDEKKRLHLDMEKNMAKILEIESSNLRTNTSLLIRSPFHYKYFGEGYDSELIDAVIKGQLQHMNVNTHQGLSLGCPDGILGNNANRILLGRNTRDYHTCAWLKASLENAIYWRYIDLSKQGAGNIESIAMLMYKLVINNGDFQLSTVGNLKDTFAPFIEAGSVREKIGIADNIRIQPLCKQFKTVCKNMFIDKSGKKIKSVGTQMTNCINIKKYLEAITLKFDEPKESLKKHYWESFAIFMYGLIQVTIASLRKIWNDVMDNMSESKIKDLDNNINSNLVALRKYLLSNLIEYIKIKPSAMNDNYGFVEGQNDDYENPKPGKKGMVRLNGGFNSIRNMSNYTLGNFLFTLVDGPPCVDVLGRNATGDCSECYQERSTLSKLQNIVYGNEKTNERVNISNTENNEFLSNNNKATLIKTLRNINSNRITNTGQFIKTPPIYIGGFTHTKELLHFSRIVFIEYYKIKYNILSNEFKYLDLIIKKMKSSIHVTEIKGMYMTLKNAYSRTAGETHSQNIMARKMLNDIKKTYFDIRKKEMVAIKSLIRTVSNLKKKGASVSNDMIDIAYIKYSHFRVKADIMKRIAFSLYKKKQQEYRNETARGHPIRRELPDKYYRNLEALFEEVDKEIRDRLREEGIDVDSIDRYLRNDKNIFNLNNIKNTGLNKKDLARLEEIENELNVRKNSALQKTKSASPTKSALQKTKSASPVKNLTPSIKISGLKGDTVFLPYVDKYNRHGFFNILAAFKRGHVATSDIIKGSAISVKSIFKTFSAMGRICVAKDKKEERDNKKWRALDGEYIKQLIKLDKAELKSEISGLFREIDTYHDKTMHYWGPRGNSWTKSKLDKYCEVIRSNGSDCDFVTNWNNIRSIVAK